MAISNNLANLEARIARFKGEEEETKLLIKQAELATKQLPALYAKLKQLEGVITAAVQVIKYDDPSWKPERVKPVRKNAHNSPIAFGEMSRKALAVMRELTRPGEGMKARQIMQEVLRREGVPFDRQTLDKRTNSLSNYLKNHRGELVESDGLHPQRWWVIR